jgi:tRNA splicing endonuclease
MLHNLEGLIRQAKQEKLSYEEFLLNLSETEVQARQENGRKRRLQPTFHTFFLIANEFLSHNFSRRYDV